MVVLKASKGADAKTQTKKCWPSDDGITERDCMYKKDECDRER